MTASQPDPALARKVAEVRQALETMLGSMVNAVTLLDDEVGSVPTVGQADGGHGAPVPDPLARGIAPLDFPGGASEERQPSESGTALARAERRLHVISNNLPLYLFEIDRDGIYTWMEGQGLESFGVSPGNQVGASLFAVHRARPELIAHVRRALAGEVVRATEEVDGVLLDAVYEPLRDRGGEIGGVIGVALDVSERSLAQAELIRRSLFDPLTDLPNAALFREWVDEAIAAARDEVRPFAVLVVALDRTRITNETYGREYGELLVQAVGQRLRSLFDGNNDTVARLDSDEFGVLLQSRSGGSDVAAVAEQIRSTFAAGFHVEGHSLALDASVGVARFPGHGDDADVLLRHAQAALSAAKQNPGGYAVYTATQDPDPAARLRLMSDLRRGIDEDQLVLHYQPKIDMESGQVRGAEALVRWQHPERGMVMPGEFIGTAERTGLLKPLTTWVIDAALRQLYAWQRDGLDMKVAVNVSVESLRDPDFPSQLSTALDAWGVPAEKLQLEITESALMVEPEAAVRVLTRLEQMGVGLIVDDFGTGYSAMTYLKLLPVDEIKIDQAFVRGVAADEKDSLIVEAIIGMSKGMGRRVVAEGVETQETWTALAALHCDMAQGYYMCRPLDASEFTNWLSGPGASLHMLN